MNMVTSFVQNIQTAVNNKLNRNPYRIAVSSALISVTSTHPDFDGIGFDEHFMNNEAADVIESFLAGGPMPTADALTTAWATQFPFSEASAKVAIENITPMAKEFLYVLSTETAFIPAIEQESTQPVHVYPTSVPEYNLA